MMDRRLFALVIVFIFVIAGVRISDPALNEKDATVEFVNRPAVIAADSVRVLQNEKVTITYQVTVDSRVHNKTYTKYGRIKVEHDNQRYLAVRSTDNQTDWEIGFFGTDGMGWSKSPYTRWGRTPSSRYPGFATVMDPAVMEQATAQGLIDNSTVFAVRFEDEAANDAVQGLDGHTETHVPGHLDIYIDKQRGLPIRAVRVYSIPKRNTTVHINYKFTHYGETEVRRPNSVPRLSLWEFLGDIYYG